jgi:hypothetical protein
MVGKACAFGLLVGQSLANCLQFLSARRGHLRKLHFQFVERIEDNLRYGEPPGLISGLVMLLIFKSIPVASGKAATVIVAIIALKHLALFVAVSSPAVALFQTLKLKARPFCPWPPEND